MQLFGYYAAALTVDWKWVGRKRMTTFSFFMVCPCLPVLAPPGFPHLASCLLHAHPALIHSLSPLRAA
jgi:hypothetical protein